MVFRLRFSSEPVFFLSIIHPKTYTMNQIPAYIAIGVIILAAVMLIVYVIKNDQTPETSELSAKNRHYPNDVLNDIVNDDNNLPM